MGRYGTKILGKKGDCFILPSFKGCWNTLMNCPPPHPALPQKNNNLAKPKGFAETEISELKDLDWVLPLFLSRCSSVMFNTQAAHQHPGSSLNATGEAGKEPGSSG